VGEIESLKQLIAWQPPSFDSIIGEGIMLPETRMLIFGAAKSWKSMLAIHTGFTLSQGLDWFGYKTAQCTVFLLQVELPKAAYRKRVVKYSYQQQQFPDNLFFKTEHRLKVDTGFGLASLERDMERISHFPNCGHILLIIDPVYMLMSGHISDAYDTQKLLDNIDIIREKYHCSIILIHHAGKQVINDTGFVDRGAEAMMGSSYLNNWCDTAIRMDCKNPFTGGNLIDISFELVRHAESVLPKFQVEFSRKTLYPTITKIYSTDNEPVEDVSTRELR
jgi:RecA-family ATPase